MRGASARPTLRSPARSTSPPCRHRAWAPPPAPTAMMRSLRHSARAALLTGAALVVLAPDSAHAQLGGLKRRLGEKVGKAVLGEESAGKSAAPAFSDRVLQIDDARFDQLLRGLKVEAAEAQKSERAQAAENAKMAEQQKKDEAYAGCSEPFA